MAERKYLKSLKTKAAIREAFVDLLAEKGSTSNITIAEIAERANITRGTFYTHYKSIHGVAQDLESEVYRAFAFEPTATDALEDFEVFLDSIFSILKQNSELYSKLLKSHSAVSYMSTLNDEMEKNMFKILKNHKVKNLTEKLDVAFYCNGATQLILHHFRNDLKLNLDDLRWYLLQKFKEMLLK